MTQSNNAAERSAHVERGTERQASRCIVCGKPDPAHAARAVPGTGIIQACSRACAGDVGFKGGMDG